MTRIVTRGQNNWQPRTRSVWQRERRDGKLQPMQQEKKSFWGLFGGGK